MTSSLWKACSEGNIQVVHELLKTATMADVEIKDETGATPLTEAVKKGHVEIVRALLDKGANPSYAFPEDLSELDTSDPTIQELLNSVQQPSMIASSILSHDRGDAFGAASNVKKRYEYGSQPAVVYPYYADVNPLPPSPAGATYYSPVPSQNTVERSAVNCPNNSNLPPPEVARFIPCRYFPACRYGAACLFAHPPAPYYQGTAPSPTQYVAPFEHIGLQPYPQGYYHPPPFQPPTSHTHNLAPVSNPVASHPTHARSSSEVLLPVQQPPFPPNSMNSTLPYPHMSPGYSHPSHPLPLSNSPLSHLPPPLQPTQPPSNMYKPPATALVHPYEHDSNGPYSLPHSNHVEIGNHEGNDTNFFPNQQLLDNGNPNHLQPTHRENHSRRSKMHHRGSFPARKPPCLFFPSGRCKNGEDCRFPHVLPDGSGNNQSHLSGRNGRGRYVNGNGAVTVTDKFVGLAVRDEINQQGESGRSLTDPVRLRHSHTNGSRNNHQPNGGSHTKKIHSMKQRVPNADEFPVLGGAATFSVRNGMNLNGNGPTAAQVLQAPPPRRDTSKDCSPRGTTPDSATSTTSKIESGVIASITFTHEHTTTKLPVSFAAAAASELPKEIILSA